MKHLSIEDIINYVNANKVDKETLELLSRVNGHIRTCSSCRKTLDSYECINDEIKKEAVLKGKELNQPDDLIEIKNISKNYY